MEKTVIREEFESGNFPQLSVIRGDSHDTYYLCVEKNGEVREIAVFKDKDAVDEFTECLTIFYDWCKWFLKTARDLRMQGEKHENKTNDI